MYKQRLNTGRGERLSRSLRSGPTIHWNWLLDLHLTPGNEPKESYDSLALVFQLLRTATRTLSLTLWSVKNGGDLQLLLLPMACVNYRFMLFTADIDSHK